MTLEEFEWLQNPRELSRYVRERILDDGRYYVFIDEIQMSRKILKDGVDPARIAKEDEPGMWFTFYDVVERNNIADPSLLESIVDVVSSSVGSLTNPKRLSDTIASREGAGPSAPTVRKYLGFLKDAYIFREAKRYDVRGRRYLDYPMKYYAEDVGLRNARLGFREQEETHLMENAIYNELVRCGYSVDVGVVDVWSEKDGTKIVKHHEIDFVVNTGFEKVYVQSAFSISDPEYRAREVLPLNKSGDSFRKIVITAGASRLWTDDDGISYIGILTFLLDPNGVI